jgi:predicted HTH domain antitoxin
MKRTNVMRSEKQLKRLKEYARAEGRTMGHIIREAVDRSYERKNPLEERRGVAVRAYEEGLISLGKLAEVLGVNPISARSYLKELGIRLRVQDVSAVARDAANA